MHLALFLGPLRKARLAGEQSCLFDSALSPRRPQNVDEQFVAIREAAVSAEKMGSKELARPLSSDRTPKTERLLQVQKLRSSYEKLAVASQQLKARARALASLKNSYACSAATTDFEARFLPTPVAASALTAPAGPAAPGVARQGAGGRAPEGVRPGSVERGERGVPDARRGRGRHLGGQPGGAGAE